MVSKYFFMCLIFFTIKISYYIEARYLQLENDERINDNSSLQINSTDSYLKEKSSSSEFSDFDKEILDTKTLNHSSSTSLQTTDFSPTQHPLIIISKTSSKSSLPPNPFPKTISTSVHNPTLETHTSLLPPILLEGSSEESVPRVVIPNIIKPVSINDDCSDMENGDSYTQAAFLEKLTAPCRYDRLTRPGGDVKGTIFKHIVPPPDNINVQIDIRHIEAAEHLQFKMHMLLQYRYKDARLDYRVTSPERARIVGEDLLRSKIWVPHVLLENEKESYIMGHDARDIYMSIEPDGEVTYARRIKATLYCWMNLQKFPFDEQECDIRLTSWTYNASELILKWEKNKPVVIADQLHLTEYSLIGHWTEEEITEGSKQARGAFTGNYSCLKFRFHMAREMGYYMLDYFIPSIMLVCISWVSFWLQADASAPRITIGTSTMLSFITLATAQTRTLPKVSYIKASEIWFLGCTIFIFGSMVEFAFVNIIWRRKSNVELKKVNSKNILKSTLTPRLHRKELMKGTGLQKSHSCSSLDNNSTSSSKMPQYNNYLTVHSFSAGMSLPRITTESVDDLVVSDKSIPDSISLTVPGNGPNACSTDPNGEIDRRSCNHQSHTWTTMTPQEISQWIDKRSRLVFPCAFVVFNAFYWGFVYWL